MKISLLRMCYLGLAVLAAVNWVYLVFTGATTHLPGFWHVLGPDMMHTAGLWMAAAAMLLWVCAETYVRKNWIALVVLPTLFMVGIGVGLPLYLFLRTRPVS